MAVVVYRLEPEAVYRPELAASAERAPPVVARAHTTLRKVSTRVQTATSPHGKLRHHTLGRRQLPA